MYINPNSVKTPKNVLKATIIVLASWLVGVGCGYLWCYLAIAG